MMEKKTEFNELYYFSKISYYCRGRIVKVIQDLKRREGYRLLVNV